MKDETPNKEINENSDNIILTQSVKLFQKNDINSINNSTEYTQNKTKNESNFNQDNILVNKNDSNTLLNKEKFSENFLMLQNYLSSTQQQNKIKENFKINRDISDFNIGNEENKNNNISGIQKYNKNNLKKNNKINLEDSQFLNTNKTKRKKFINEFFTFNRKNVNNINKEFSYDFSAKNNIDSYSFFKENSLLIIVKRKIKIN